MEGGVLNGHGGAGVSKERHGRNTRNLNVGILHSQLGALTKGGNGRALAGEIAGLEAVAVGVKLDGGFGNGIVDAACNNDTVEGGVGTVDHNTLSLCAIIGTLGHSLGDRLGIHYTCLVHKQSGMISIVIVRFIRTACGKGGQSGAGRIQIVGVDHGCVAVIFRITVVKAGDNTIHNEGGLLTRRRSDVGCLAGVRCACNRQCCGTQDHCTQNQTQDTGNHFSVFHCKKTPFFRG